MALNEKWDLIGQQTQQWSKIYSVCQTSRVIIYIDSINYRN